MSTLARATTTSLTEDSWIRFEGTAEKQGNTFILKPSVDESATLMLAAHDVRKQDGEVVVRLGTSILNVDALKSYGSQKVSMASSLAARSACDDNSTACIGNMEVCCDTGRIIGSCDGYWGCR